jgi:hypothetical protein
VIIHQKLVILTKQAIALVNVETGGYNGTDGTGQKRKVRFLFVFRIYIYCVLLLPLGYWSCDLVCFPRDKGVLIGKNCDSV